jgi:hypothetical protein
MLRQGMKPGFDANLRPSEEIIRSGSAHTISFERV